MPKDADFNAGNNNGLAPTDSYSDTLSASGAINMWGNVWEWTSTARAGGKTAVKGGAWNSKAPIAEPNTAMKAEALTLDMIMSASE